MLLGSYYGNL